jgi:hypothetical protein
MPAIENESVMMTPRQILTGAAITILLAFFAWGTILPGTPQIYAPLNCLIILPLFLMDIDQIGSYVAIAIVPVFFWLWCLPVLRGCPTMPRRSFVIFVCAVVLSALWLVFGWGYGIQYQGSGYVAGVTIISVFCWMPLSFLALRAWRCPSAGRNLAFHVALFSWLAWYAFPYLGELP